MPDWSGVWPYFMRKNPFWKQTDYYERRQKHMEKVEELLGRIATALERRWVRGRKSQAV
jgi:hypothetical protein